MGALRWQRSAHSSSVVAARIQYSLLSSLFCINLYENQSINQTSDEERVTNRDMMGPSRRQHPPYIYIPPTTQYKYNSNTIENINIKIKNMNTFNLCQESLICLGISLRMQLSVMLMVFVCLCVCVFDCVCVCLSACLCIPLYLCVFVSLCVSVCVCLCLWLCLCVWPVMSCVMEPKCGVCGVQRLLAAHNLYLEGQMMNRGGSSQKSKLIPTWRKHWN